MNSPTLAERYVRLRAFNQAPLKDPLRYWHYAVPRLKDAFGLFVAHDPIEELHIRACNKGTKSESVAAFVVAACQKRNDLDGVPLPQWKGRVEAVQLVLDYPQQILSVQPAYLRVLGLWPHHATYKGEVLSSLRIMPVGGDLKDERTWSVIKFLSQENRRSGTGVRADIIAFDEPPRMSILRELRKAAHARRRMVMVIGETPTIRTQWGELSQDYEKSEHDRLKECPRSSIRRLDPERAEVRYSLGEVADWLIPPAEKAKLRRKYALEPYLADAREHGDYCITEGRCPFHEPTLLAMLAACDREIREVEWDITREVDGEDGRVKRVARVMLHVLEDPQPGERYYLNVDPSKGIDSPEHDPGGILVRKESTGEEVTLYEGYIGSYGLGSLAAGLGKQYNMAVVDPESNSGWSEGVMRALGDVSYGNIARTYKTGHGGKLEPRFGFETNETTRPAMIGALQAWIAAWAAGAPYARCYFPRVIRALLETVVDEKGKVVAGAGYHDEFLILKGQSLRKYRPQRDDQNMARPAIPPVRADADELTLEKLMARAQDRGHEGQGVRRSRPLPRPVG